MVGTVNNTVQLNRKMRSPPADIFVWGIHPDTAIEDIVADLSDSGIVIEEKDVEKKSKDEAYLVSYKIRLKAEDLQKALEPGVWPMRVKVREFIHYSKNNSKQQRGGVRGQERVESTGGHGQHRGPVPVDQSSSGVGQSGNQGERGELPGSLASNQFAVLADNASGDDTPAV